MVALSRGGARRRRRVGGVLPHRPPAEAAAPGPRHRRLDDGGERHPPTGCSASATRVVGDGAETAALILDQIADGTGRRR